MSASPAPQGQTPQLEGGFTRIANELLDAFLSAGLTSRQWAVVMAVIRKTYGFHKTRDNITLSILSEMTGLSRANASRTVSELVDRGILSRAESHGSMVLGIHKRYKSWGLPNRQQPEGCQTGNTGCQNGNSEGVAKMAAEELPIQQQKVLPIRQPHIKERKKEKERKAQAPKLDASATFDLPDWVDREAWDAWLEVRKAKRAPNTERALRQNLNVLEAEKSMGGDPNAVLNKSVASGWTGLFQITKERKSATSAAREEALRTGMWNGRKLTPSERFNLERFPNYLPMAAGGG